MKKDFETRFTAWSFIVAAILLWGGWALSPHQVEEYLIATDFPAIGNQVWTWIWMFRLHIFGWVAMAISIFALSTYLSNKPHRVVLLPGSGMIIVGTITLAIAYAFYYNFGAWGVGQTAGKSAAEVQEFMNDILYTNQYVTCFLRFGRIFSGVGLVLLGYGFIRWKLVRPYLGWLTALLGVLAMAIILFIPEYFESYKPLFHLKVIWLIAMGAELLSSGVSLEEENSNK